ncbi:unnamed protein product [Ectocarpus fasciculatus]
MGTHENDQHHGRSPRLGLGQEDDERSPSNVFPRREKIGKRPDNPSTWWSEQEAAATAGGPAGWEGQAAALRVGSTRGFFAAFTDVLSRSTGSGGETTRDGSSGSSDGDGGATGAVGDPLSVLRVALRTAERVASAAVLSLSSSPAKEPGVAAGSRLEEGDSPAVPPRGRPSEEATTTMIRDASAVAGRFLHALLPVVGVCDALLEGDVRAAGGRGRRRVGGRPGEREGEEEEEACALAEAVRLLGVMARMPWWVQEGKLEDGNDDDHRHRRRQRPCGGGGAGGAVAGARGEGRGERVSVVGISERWTTLSTLTSLLRPETSPAYPGTPEQKLKLQRAAVDCLSTVISRAGPETIGMLLAHRLPAVLCRCILRRHHSPLATPCSTGARGGVGDVAIGSPAVALPSGRHRRRRHRQRFPLAPPAVRALSLLVQPTGPQWRPIRPMPFREAAAAAAAAAAATQQQQQEEQRFRLASSQPPSPLAAAAGLDVDMKAAVELASSVWRQTAQQLLEDTTSGGNRGNGTGTGGGSRRGGGENNASLATAEEDGGGGGGGGGLDFFGEEAGPDRGVRDRRGPPTTNPVAVLCGIICDVEEDEEDATRWDSPGSAAYHRDEIAAATTAAAAPFCGQHVGRRRSSEGGGDGGGGDGGGGRGDTTRSAALRVLLHSCRASPGVARAIVAFDGGAAVQALLGRLCLPPSSQAGPNVSAKNRHHRGIIMAPRRRISTKQRQERATQADTPQPPPPQPQISLPRPSARLFSSSRPSSGTAS